MFYYTAGYIYLYNSININSLTHTTEENDIELYETYKNEFKDCLLYLSEKWDLTKLPTLYISHKYDKKYECKINEETYSISMNLNYPDIVSDLNYLYIKTWE